MTFHKPFKFNSRQLIIAEIYAEPSQDLIFEKVHRGHLYLFNLSNSTYSPWIKYPIRYTPVDVELTITKNKEKIYILSGDSRDSVPDKALKLYQITVKDKKWKHLCDFEWNQIHINQTTVYPFMINESNIAMIGVQQEHVITENACNSDYSYSLNCYQFNQSGFNTYNSRIKRVNANKNDVTPIYKRHTDNEISPPLMVTGNINDHKIIQIHQRGISEISRSGVVTKICGVLLDSKTDENVYDYTFGVKYIRGDILLIFNDTKEIGSTFIHIIENLSTTKRSIRTSLIQSPTITNLRIVVAEDLYDEEVTVFGYVRNQCIVDMSPYLIKIIDQYYSKETLIMFLTDLDNLFIKINVDSILNDSKAKLINESWKKDRDEAINIANT